MKSRFVVPSALVVAVVLARVFGAASSAKPTVPETSKILFENDQTRVIEYHTNSGKNICGLGLHSHPAHVFIMLTDAKLRVVTPDGKEEMVDCKAGEAG